MPTVDLPQPDSPTSDSVSPRLMSKRHAVDRVDLRGLLAQQAAVDREVLLQAVDFEQRRGLSLMPPSRPFGVVAGGAVARRLRLRSPARPRGTDRSPSGSGRRTGSRRSARAGSAPGRRSPPACRARHPAATSRASAPSPAGRACRDAAGGRRFRSTGASSTLRPAYITTTRSAISATTPRSWVISMIAEPSRVLQVAHQVEDLRLDGHVQRRGRLVGDQQLRIAGQRHGDHHALAHAAGQLVRILAHPPRRRRNADQRQHLDRLAARRRARDRP